MPARGEYTRTVILVSVVVNGMFPTVLLAPVDEDDLDQLMLSRSKRFQSLLNKSRRSIATGKGLSRDAFWRAVQKWHSGKQ
jgi:hypothetical protein